MVTETLIAAMILVESGGNDTLAGPRGELGCLQITPAVVEDCNRIIRGNVFSLDDRLNREQSIRMAILWLTAWVTTARVGRDPLPEDYARCWNGGPDWRRNAYKTDEYWHKVKMALKGFES